MPDSKEIKTIIEALLFISEKPLLIEQVKEVIPDIDSTVIRSLIDELRQDYLNNKRGLSIIEVAGGFRMTTNPDLANYIKRFYKKRQQERLTGPSLETLAIIAYKQPLSRLEIEAIRGVNVDGVISTLLEKGLIRIAGRKEAVGRPFVYGTTRQFLEYFGLKSLEELPKLEEFTHIPGLTQEDIEPTPVKSNEDTLDTRCQGSV
ncbi:MAG: SMC-Scp complex subunit ScpB [Candidatus Omnitrophota bacterium]